MLQAKDVEAAAFHSINRLANGQDKLQSVAQIAL